MNIDGKPATDEPKKRKKVRVGDSKNMGGNGELATQTPRKKPKLVVGITAEIDGQRGTLAKQQGEGVKGRRAYYLKESTSKKRVVSSDVRVLEVNPAENDIKLLRSWITFKQTKGESLNELMNTLGMVLFQNSKLDLVGQADDLGFTPLMLACQAGESKNVEWILWHPSVKVNDRNRSGDTALLLALKLNHIEIAKLLLQDCRVNVTHGDGEGVTPLMCAIMLRTPELVSSILSHVTMDSAGLMARDKMGLDAATLAHYLGRPSINEVLQRNPDLARRRQEVRRSQECAFCLEQLVAQRNNGFRAHAQITEPCTPPTPSPQSTPPPPPPPTPTPTSPPPIPTTPPTPPRQPCIRSRSSRVQSRSRSAPTKFEVLKW